MSTKATFLRYFVDLTQPLMGERSLNTFIGLAQSISAWVLIRHMTPRWLNCFLDGEITLFGEFSDFRFRPESDIAG
jgi:hypothetical protein